MKYTVIETDKLYSPTFIVENDTVYNNALSTHTLQVFGVHFGKISQLKKNIKDGV